MGRPVFPSSCKEEVPDLIDETLDGMPTPVVSWGSRSRGSTATVGTWHFYVDDYRYGRLWQNPDMAVRAAPEACCELNETLTDHDPYPVALHAIYRKRWLSRYWQSCGIDVFVDLSVPERYRALNLLGVPKGWGAWSTRVHLRGKCRPDDPIGALAAEVEIAKGHGSTRCFVVFGPTDPELIDACRAMGLLLVRSWQPEEGGQ